MSESKEICNEDHKEILFDGFQNTQKTGYRKEAEVILSLLQKHYKVELILSISFTLFSQGCLNYAASSLER